MARTRHRGENGLDAWPGYVDALSTLLMVIIFVLLVFVLAQAFLTATLAGRNDTLAKVRIELQQMSNALSLEKGQEADLRLSLAKLNRDLTETAAARDTLASQLAAVTAAERNDQTTIVGLTEARKADQATIATLTQAGKADQATIAALTQAGKADQATIAALNAAAAADKATIAARLADMERLRNEMNQTVTADKATIEARLADIAKLMEQMKALTALRDELERKVRDAAAATMTEQERRAAVQAQLANEQRLADSARAQIALLNQQVTELRAQFQSVQDALGIEKKAVADKELEITNLVAKLNAALAEKVEELKQYRSEFFGKLRSVLSGRPGIQVVGDRFVFQSEVLFPVGKAEMTPAGVAQMTEIAATIKDVSTSIPPDLHWILRVDGHTDPQPLKGGAFASNWELSVARAVTVVKLLISLGVPPNHLAATGFGEFQPIAPGDSEDAWAKDRRIELRLTDR
jgi:chemotaxis protein MotB